MSISIFVKIELVVNFNFITYYIISFYFHIY